MDPIETENPAEKTVETVGGAYNHHPTPQVL